jgi:hypothetical protein
MPLREKKKSIAAYSSTLCTGIFPILIDSRTNANTKLDQPKPSCLRSLQIVYFHIQSRSIHGTRHPVHPKPRRKSAAITPPAKQEHSSLRRLPYRANSTDITIYQQTFKAAILRVKNSPTGCGENITSVHGAGQQHLSNIEDQRVRTPAHGFQTLAIAFDGPDCEIEEVTKERRDEEAGREPQRKRCPKVGGGYVPEI